MKAPDEAARLAPAAILFAHHGSDWITGSERCLLDLVARLDRRRFTPIVLCDTPTIAAAAAESGVTVYQSPTWLGDENRLWPGRAATTEVTRIIQRHDIRLIHANDTDPLKVLVAAARNARIPILAHLHIVLDRHERCASWLHQVSLAVGVSELAVRGLREDGVAPGSLTVIYNGVDSARLGTGDARGLRRQCGIPDDAIVAAAVGSLIPRKGADVLLAAMRLLYDRSPAVHLLVLGDGPERSALEEQANRLGIAPRVHLLGRRSDVGAVLRDAADIVVSAARAEAFPLNLLEAGLFGRPVIASAIDAHMESVVPGETGLLVAPDSAAAFAEAIWTLITHPEQRLRLGRAGQQRVLDRFLVQDYITHFERIYGDLLARPPGSAGWLRATRWPAAYNDWVASTVRKRLGRAIPRRRAAADRPRMARG